MTQPPYVPPRDDDSTPPVWPATTQEPTYTGSTYSEPVSSVAVGGDYLDSGQSTTDVAKDQAGNVKDTAVDQGQQVAGVAKEQAGAVKDTAVEQGQQVAGVAKEQAGAVKDTAVEQGQHVAGVAKEQAGAVKDTAVEQGQHVAGVAKEQVSEIASEATGHVRDLLSEGLSEVRSQAGSQQKRLATAVHSLADELGTMASKSDKSGPLTDYAKQLSHRGGEVAHWLENAEPSELLDAVRSFARRRPAVFLGLSALAGAVTGRVTRGFVANAKDEKQPAALTSSSYSGTTGTTTGYSAAPQQYGVESGTASPYSQDVAGSGYTADPAYTTDQTYATDQTYTTNTDYATGESSRYGTGNEGVTR